MVKKNCVICQIIMSRFKQLVYEGNLFSILGELKDDLPGEQSSSFTGEISYKYVPYKFIVSKDIFSQKGRSINYLNEKSLPIMVLISLNDGLLDGKCSISYNQEVLVSGNWSYGKLEGNILYYYDKIPYYHGQYNRGLPNGDFGVANSYGLFENKSFRNGYFYEVIETQEDDYLINTYYNDSLLIYMSVLTYKPANTSWKISYSSCGYPIMLEQLNVSGGYDLVKRFYLKDSTTVMVVTNKNSLIYCGEYSFYPPFWFVYNGNGTLYMNKKIMYNGSFKNGLRHGIGCLYYSNGTLKYKGEWKNDLPDGNGSLYRSDGTLWGTVQCTKGHFISGLRNRSIFTFLPSHGITEFFNSNLDPSQLDESPSWTFDPQFFSVPSLSFLDGKQQTSPVLRYNKEKCELLNSYEALLNLDMNQGISNIHSLWINNSAISNLIHFSEFIGLEDLHIGDNTFVDQSSLVLSEMLFLKNVTIGDNCFNGTYNGMLVFQRLPNLQTISVGTSFTNVKQFEINGLSFSFCLFPRLL